MLHPLLHGKLDPAIAEPQRLEEALTPSVLGTLVLVEAWDLLAVWLGADSTTVDGRQDVECWFWPRLAGGVEPDVAVWLGQTLVVVEVKYRSGRHDLALDDPDDERPVDQIVRQHRAVSPLTTAAAGILNPWSTPFVVAGSSRRSSLTPGGFDERATSMPSPARSCLNKPF
jgi:hypothetical protein